MLFIYHSQREQSSAVTRLLLTGSKYMLCVQYLHDFVNIFYFLHIILNGCIANKIIFYLHQCRIFHKKRICLLSMEKLYHQQQTSGYIIALSNVNVLLSVIIYTIFFQFLAERSILLQYPVIVMICCLSSV